MIKALTLTLLAMMFIIVVVSGVSIKAKVQNWRPTAEEWRKMCASARDPKSKMNRGEKKCC
jgi:hypothetical protein